MPDSVLNDTARLAALARSGLLDAPRDAYFDHLTELARRLLHTPVALITLVDDHRQFLASALGLSGPWAEQRETPLTHSFCQYVVRSGQPLLVSDARLDEALRHNAAVSDLGVVAYAGVPLMSEDGFALGALCAIDHEPREWTPEQLDILTLLRSAVMSRIALAEQMATTRQKAQALETAVDALATAERYYRALTENALDLVTLVAMDGAIKYKSASALRSLGYEPGDLIGQQAFDFVHPQDRGQVEDLFSRLVQHPGESMETEFRFRHRDGSYRVLAGKGVNLFGIPEVGAIVFNSSDVTARRRAEEQLRRAQKLETIAQLTAGTVHDLNNSLTVILGNVELMLHQATGADSPASRPLGDVRAATLSAIDLTKRLLAVSRQAPLQPRPTDLNVVTQSIVRLVRRALPRNVRMECKAAEGLPTAVADAGAIEQVLLNLIANARDAMPGGGLIRVETAAEHITPNFRAQYSWATGNEYVALRIRDSGSGMDEDTCSQIFEPFFTTKEQGKGTGLGLPMVLGIATQLRGGVTVESAPGEGTTVSVYLRAA